MKLWPLLIVVLFIILTWLNIAILDILPLFSLIQTVKYGVDTSVERDIVKEGGEEYSSNEDGVATEDGVVETC